MTRGQGLIAAAVALLINMVSPAHAAASVQPCVPTVLTSSPAACTFNIWGFVRDANGNPVAGATVSDGSKIVESRSDGFYDMYELGPGSYVIDASKTGAGCSVVIDAPVAATSAIINGGAHYDLNLPCVVV